MPPTLRRNINDAGHRHDGQIYTPIGFGTNYTEGAKAQEFAGEFDGGGHTISNVTVNPSYHTCVGIFGATKSGAVIKNLKVANPHLRERPAVGEGRPSGNGSAD